MYIKSFIVQNFRTLKDFSIEFEKGYNIIIGKNNTGKSNILKFLDKVFNDECKFEPIDVTTINNTERSTPEFKINTSIGIYEKKNKNMYYLNENRIRVNYEQFKSELNKVKIIYIDIQKEYDKLTKIVVDKYNEFNEVSSTTYDSQINIDFSNVMGNGNNIYIKDESIYIIDEYSETSKIENKSSGVQRVALIICLINLFKIEKTLSKYVLLIDEPEGNLHVKAQKKMFDLLINFSKHHQVIISSHSTVFMKNRDFGVVNYVDREKNSGTFIDNDNLGVKNFKKIRESLGLEINDTLFLNNEIIAVEGESDVILHEYIYERLNPNNNQYTFFTIEGADNAIQNIIALKQILNKDITIILDYDSKGRDIEDNIRKKDFVKQSKVIFQPNNKTSDGELEDLFPKDFLKTTILSFIKKQEEVIKEKMNNTYDEEIEIYKKKLNDINLFRDVEKIGSDNNQYSLKGKNFIRYIRSRLKELEDEEFQEIVKEFKSLYEQF